MKLLTLVTLLWAATEFTSGDMLPNPNPYNVTLPNGQVVGPLLLKGTSGYSWEVDDGGYTVVFDNSKGLYFYAQQTDDGDIEPSTIPWGENSNPETLGFPKDIQPTDEIKTIKCGEYCEYERDNERRPNGLREERTPSHMKNLVVLLKFQDQDDKVVPSEADIDILMNHAGTGTAGNPYHNLAPSGSVREVYLKTSYSSLTIDSTVVPWVTIHQNETFCANGASGLSTVFHQCLKSALDLVDDLIDFSDFDVDGDTWMDAITFLHSGYGAEWGGGNGHRIWSHKWQFYSPWYSKSGVKVAAYHISPALWGTSGTTIGRIGVIAHETGHYLGLPDLYGGQYDSGIGSWGLMANSWGFDGTQYFPPPMSAWSKEKLGWATVVVIDPRDEPYTLQRQCDSDIVYKITRNYPDGEYLLIENRHNSCWYDSKSSTSGLIIFHIDENANYNDFGHPEQDGWPENGNHYRVAVLQADADYDLENGLNRGDGGDPWVASQSLGQSTSGSGPHPNTDAYQSGNVYKTNNCISDITLNGSDMSFKFLSCEDSSPSPSAMPSASPTANPSASSFQIVSSLSEDSDKEWCIVPMNNSVKAGVKLVISECKGWQPFFWEIDNEGKIKNHKDPSFCIELANRNIRLGPCVNEKMTQRWLYSMDKRILSANNGTKGTAAVDGGVASSNTLIKLLEYGDVMKHESWTFKYMNSGVIVPVPDLDEFKIVSAINSVKALGSNSSCLYPTQNTLQAGQKLTTVSCKDWKAYKWTMDDEGKLRNAKDDSLCLELRGRSVRIQLCEDGFRNQMWVYSIMDSRLVSLRRGTRAMAIPTTGIVKLQDSESPIPLSQQWTLVE